MKKGFKEFVILWAVFSIGLFFGDWLLDFIFYSSWNEMKIEALDSIVIGLIVAFMLATGNKSLKKSYTTAVPEEEIE